MAGLQFVDFALMPGPERRRSNSSHYGFSKIDVTIPSRTNHPAVFHDADGPLFGDPQNILHDECEARNLNIFALRGRNRHLLAAEM